MKCSVLVVLLLKIYISEGYKAAVIDYYYEYHNNFSDNIKHNLNNLLKLIADTVQHSDKEMDLIVLPEAGIVRQWSYSKEEILLYASFVPAKKSSTIPCLEKKSTASYVQALSCASIKHRVYISADIVEKTTSSELFNTNIVFDRNGKIVSKYRKRHLFSEHFISNSTQEIEYFTTDFGVTFGVLICFDMLFKDTYRELLDKHIEHFIFPSFWFSSLPYLSSVQTQLMWSYKHNVTLLASDINQVFTGSGGSGIYMGRRGSSMSYLSAEPHSKVLSAEVPSFSEENHTRNLKNFKFFKDNTTMDIYSLDNYPANSFIQERKCYNDFCCLFKLNVNDTNGLAITIFNGHQNIGGFAKLGFQMCAIVQCQIENDFKCATIPEPHYFDKIYQQLEIQVVNQTFEAEYYPNVALQNLHFLPTHNYSFQDDLLTLKLTKPSGRIYTFGFFGRNYKIDEIK